MNANITTLFLEVSDNGVGFDTRQQRSTMGLDLIEALTTQVDGEFTITSDAAGTKCVVEIPK